MEKLPGYGSDKYCERAKLKIREVCKCPQADIYFLVGGTQTNATVIDSLLNQYEGVVAASTGHVSIHEAGAIEFTGVAGDIGIKATQMLRSGVCYSTNDTLKVTVKNIFGRCLHL